MKTNKHIIACAMVLMSCNNIIEDNKIIVQSNDIYHSWTTDVKEHSTTTAFRFYQDGTYIRFDLYVITFDIVRGPFEKGNFILDNGKITFFPIEGTCQSLLNYSASYLITDSYYLTIQFPQSNLHLQLDNIPFDFILEANCPNDN